MTVGIVAEPIIEAGKKTVEGVKNVVEAVNQSGTQVVERIANPAEIKAIMEQTAGAFPAKGVALVESVKTDGLSAEQVSTAKTESGVDTKIAAANEKVRVALATAQKKLDEAITARDLSSTTLGYTRRDEAVESAREALAQVQASETPPPVAPAPAIEAAAASEPKKSLLEESADDMASFGYNAAIPAAVVAPVVMEQSVPLAPAPVAENVIDTTKAPVAEVVSQVATEAVPAPVVTSEKRKFDMGIEEVVKTPSRASTLYKSITNAMSSRFNKINDRVNAIDAKYVEPIDKAIIEAGTNLAAGTAKKFEQVKTFASKVQERQKIQKEKYNKLNAYGKLKADINRALLNDNPIGLIAALPKFLLRFAGERLKEFKNAQIEAKKKYDDRMNALKMQQAEKKATAEKIAKMKKKMGQKEIFDMSFYSKMKKAEAAAKADASTQNVETPAESEAIPMPAAERVGETVKIPEVVSDYVFKMFTDLPKEKYKVPAEVIEALAQKVKDFKQLTPRELAIRNAYGQEINVVLVKDVEATKQVESAPVPEATATEKQEPSIDALKLEAKAKLEAAQAEYDAKIKELEGQKYYTEPVAETPSAANNYGYTETGPNAADNYGYAEQNTEAANNYGYAEQPVVAQLVSENVPAQMSDAERIAKFTQMENERKQKEQLAYDQRSREIVSQQNAARAAELNPTASAPMGQTIELNNTETNTTAQAA